jgi:hypothetical protein
MNWKFTAVSADGPTGLRWSWERLDETKNAAVTSAETFAYYNECMQDATKHGYRIPPPRAGIA